MSPEEGPAESWRRFAFEVPGAEIGILRGDVRRPDSVTDRAIVVCHGFKGFKNWGFFPYLADRLAQRTGALVVSFNFSGSGIGPDLETFTDLEGFARNTFSRELADLGRILDGLERGRLGEVSFDPPGRVGLIGHSRGAAAAILAGAARPEVRAVVTWAGIGSVFRYEDHFAEGLERDGVMQILNARTGQRLPLYRDVLDDLRANREALDMEAGAATLGPMLLIVHGTADEAVPVREAYALHAAAPGSHLAIIEGAGHTMDASHPFPGSNSRLDEAVLGTVNHFQRFLAEDPV
ncbi:MAG: alpha/beta fold hydrolase [marine benthic group bacterium]|jgi:dienelactone hydrolase|nr:alpha/beta fold hydrolase [Candidatus Benthicola marisminoris]